jgi:2-oxoacid:acceptor oxidoreductase gamma subunit (pyruvate/2-ketoisovalerate family)
MPTQAAKRIHQRLERGDSIDVRGYGKAGGGLVLAIQAFGEALTNRPELDVHDWPLFSSARKGANVCAYLRIARGKVENASRITRPDIALLMNEAAAADVDFAEGTEEALYLVNSPEAPEAIGARYRLAGTVVTVPGDSLGREYLDRPLANVAVLAALVKASGLVDVKVTRDSLEHRFEKRRVPRRIIDKNLALYDASLERSRTAELPVREGIDHPLVTFKGYGELPAGAQSMLRTSLTNRTASYGRPGVSVEFKDPTKRCNGCSLCVVQCPEGIIEFVADPNKGALVSGARFATHCKTCRECIAACPLDLFTEISTVAPPENRIEGA